MVTPINLQSEAIQPQERASPAWNSYSFLKELEMKTAHSSAVCLKGASKACNSVQARILPADIKKWKDLRFYPRI